MRLVLFTLALAPVIALGQADTPGSHDHPAVKRWPGAVITDGEYRDSESFKFPLSDGLTKKVEGRYLFNIYRLPPRVTCAQLTRNYETAFKAQVFAQHSGTAVPAPDVVWPAGKWVAGEGKSKAGGQIFVLVGCPADDFEGPEMFLWVIENQRMQPVVEPDAVAIADGLSKDGRIALYGLNFAGKKADLTPDSARTLEALAKVLENQPGWMLRIEGHTDNVGGAKANLALSKKRANAVKAWLTAKLGVAADRLTTEAFGDTKPASANTTDIGRANNRRIEVMKLAAP